MVTVAVGDKYNPGIGIIAGILSGVIFGALNGFLVGYLKLASMIVTLGMSNIARTVALVVTNGAFVSLNKPEDQWFGFIGRESILGLPVQFYIYIIMVVIFQFVLKRSAFGHKISAVGGNRVAARYTGIDDSRTQFKTYLLLGLCVGIAGVVQSSRSMAAQSTVGEGAEFEVLTAVILGGTSIQGGSGSVVKSIIGIVIIGILKNGFVMLGLPYYFQWLAQCIIMIVIIWIDLALSRKKVLI